MASIKHRTSGSVLGTIRAAQIVDTKPFIPAGTSTIRSRQCGLTKPEIISAIMDHLAAPDLIRCARASRNLRDMVYDDSRWVQRLRAMGCWNEAAARARGQNAEKRGSVGTVSPYVAMLPGISLSPRPLANIILNFQNQTLLLVY